MASKPDTGPDRDDRENPGDTSTNPAGASAENPAEGGDDTPPREPGSPAG